jgi:hypothetical protein
MNDIVVNKLQSIQRCIERARGGSYRLAVDKVGIVGDKRPFLVDNS